MGRGRTPVAVVLIAGAFGLAGLAATALTVGRLASGDGLHVSWAVLGLVVSHGLVHRAEWARIAALAVALFAQVGGVMGLILLLVSREYTFHTWRTGADVPRSWVGAALATLVVAGWAAARVLASTRTLRLFGRAVG